MEKAHPVSKNNRTVKLTALEKNVGLFVARDVVGGWTLPIKICDIDLEDVFFSMLLCHVVDFGNHNVP